MQEESTKIFITSTLLCQDEPIDSVRVSTDFMKAVDYYIMRL